MRIHPTAEIKSNKIGDSTQVWQFAVILAGARIGENCNINCHVFIENDVTIGNNVTVKSGVYLWDGLSIEDNVFIGPNVSFTNDKQPRSKQFPLVFQRTLIKYGASLGAASIILGGVTIGEWAMVAAGALVTKDVPARALVLGQPARVVAWLNEDGSRMKEDGGYLIDNNARKWVLHNNRLEKL